MFKKSTPKDRKSKNKDKSDSVANYTIIRTKSKTYVPLRKLGFFGKVSTAARYMFDKKYREEQLIRQRQRQAEELLDKTNNLRRFILNSLKNIPPEAHEITIQIDNNFVPVLKTVLTSTVELSHYDIKDIMINPNYLTFVKKPHKLIVLTPDRLI